MSLFHLLSVSFLWWTKMRITFELHRLQQIMFALGQIARFFTTTCNITKPGCSQLDSNLPKLNSNYLLTDFLFILHSWFQVSPKSFPMCKTRWFLCTGCAIEQMDLTAMAYSSTKNDRIISGDLVKLRYHSRNCKFTNISQQVSCTDSALLASRWTYWQLLFLRLKEIKKEKEPTGCSEVVWLFFFFFYFSCQWYIGIKYIQRSNSEQNHKTKQSFRNEKTAEL